MSMAYLHELFDMGFEIVGPRFLLENPTQLPIVWCAAGPGRYAEALGRAETRACQALTLVRSSGIGSPIHSAKSTVESAQMSAIE